MKRLQSVYYRDATAREPVNDFIDSLPDRAQAAIDLQIGRLNDLTVDDPPLAFPHSSQVDGELRELRCHFGRRLFRILYRRSHNLVILLHMFEKSSRKAPQSDIKIAQDRWEDFQRRMGELPRRPPRAAGHDAP